MPTAQFIQDGDAIDYTPPSAITAGDVVVLGKLIGIAKIDIPASTLGALAVTGVFDLPKATGASTAIPIGSGVYWDVADQQASEDDDGNEYLGRTILAAGDNDTSVRVRLEQ